MLYSAQNLFTDSSGGLRAVAAMVRLPSGGAGSAAPFTHTQVMTTESMITTIVPIVSLRRIAAGGLLLACTLAPPSAAAGTCFPPPEAQGGWRSLVPANEVPSAAEKKAVLDRTGLEWDKLAAAWNHLQGFGGSNGLLVIRNGWIAAEWDNIRRPIPIHSCTKSLTGLALAKLFDLSDAGQLAKKIGLESFAYDFLPATWGQADPRRKLIRIKHLMTMSSGLFAWDGGRDLEGLSRWDYFLTRPVVAAPGKVWAYNSLGVTC